MARMHAALVLPEGHVQDPVQASRDAPVCPRRRQQVSNLGGMTGDEVAGFDTDPSLPPVIPPPPAGGGDEQRTALPSPATFRFRGIEVNVYSHTAKWLPAVGIQPRAPDRRCRTQKHGTTNPGMSPTKSQTARLRCRWGRSGPRARLQNRALHGCDWLWRPQFNSALARRTYGARWAEIQ